MKRNILFLTAAAAAFTVAPTRADFPLELLHATDQEAAAAAVNDAPRFSAVLNALRAQDLGNDGLPDNTLTLSSGDALIPGLFYEASLPVYGGRGIADILIQNELGFQAIAFGNHEFDFGTAVIAALIKGTADGAGPFAGTTFPYLSTNLDFSTDPNMAPLAVPAGGSPQPNTITNSVVINVNGEPVGVIGATTPTLRTISSPGSITVNPQPFGGTPSAAELDALAASIQAGVDALLAANPGLNKVILLAHMQQIAIEQQLAARLRHVDIIVAGGSNSRLFDANDRPRAGDSTQGTYPIWTTDADGKDVPVVNTDGSYKYVGRLVIGFDALGQVVKNSYDTSISGAYATDDQGVADLGAAALVDPEIQAIAGAIGAQIIATDGNYFGVTDEYLNGLRSGGDFDGVRTQETNLGNLTADANLAAARQLDPTTVLSIKNGGGIRASIGELFVPPGYVGAPLRVPPAANPLSGRPAGGISENAIKGSLAFNNGLTLLTVTRADLRVLLEHGVAATAPGASPGRFPQVSGVRFSYDESLPAGSRILSASLFDETSGTALSPLVENGALVGNPAEPLRIVTLNFLASGGDGYPFPSGPATNRVDLVVPGASRTGTATFADDGSEQDALAELLAANFPDPGTAYRQADLWLGQDPRIQSLTFRSDTANFPPPPASNISVAKIADFATGSFDEGAAEIAAFDPRSRRIFFTNAEAATMTVLDASNPAAGLQQIDQIDIGAAFGFSFRGFTVEANPNSVDVADGLVAVAVARTLVTPEERELPLPGLVAVYDTSSRFVGLTGVGFGPDALVFSPDGSRLVVANEGEPSADYAIDPPGSVSVIDITKHRRKGISLRSRDADFCRFRKSDLLADGVRIFGPGASVAQDLEPEFCCIAADGVTAFVTLQENNAVAEVDLRSAKVRSVMPLGKIDHLATSELDASDKDDRINISNWPVFGLFLPDAIACYEFDGCTYLVTANEGDARDYDGFAEEARVKDLVLDPTSFPAAGMLQNDAAIGRLTVTTTDGDGDGDGDFDQLNAFGTRSFSIWKVDHLGRLSRVFDSGAALEKITASLLPAEFNSTNDENGSFDNRSDNKGPEPEGVTLGEVNGRLLAFIGLERIGGVMIYDVTDPGQPAFVRYVNARDFTGDAEAGTAGDLGPEGLEFIPAADSPTGNPLLIVANEVSGNVSVFEITD